MDYEKDGVDERWYKFFPVEVEEGEQQQLEKDLARENFDVVIFADGGVWVHRDPNSDFLPTAIPVEEGDRLRREISAIAVDAREEERMLSGFDNAGNLNIEKDWTGTPEEEGERMMLEAMDAEHLKDVNRIWPERENTAAMIIAKYA